MNNGDGNIYDKIIFANIYSNKIGQRYSDDENDYRDKVHDSE